jgi:hypothetical protein
MGRRIGVWRREHLVGLGVMLGLDGLFGRKRCRFCSHGGLETKQHLARGRVLGLVCHLSNSWP